MEKLPLINVNYYCGLLEDIDNEEIVRHIEEFGKPTGTHDNVTFEDILLPDSPEINVLLTKLERLVSYASQNTELTTTAQWALKLSHGQSVIAHSHLTNTHMYPEDYWSAVYYPKADPDSAKLIFSVNWCNVVQKQIEVSPQSGMYVIFPAYVTHLTTRHSLTEDRYVIGANYDPTTPRTKPNVDWSIYSDRPAVG